MSEARETIQARIRVLLGMVEECERRSPVPVVLLRVLHRDLRVQVATLTTQIEALETAAAVDPLAQLPALERWRAQVLESKGRHPLEVAAAWELTAFACDRVHHRGEVPSGESRRTVVG